VIIETGSQRFCRFLTEPDIRVEGTKTVATIEIQPADTHRTGASMNHRILFLNDGTDGVGTMSAAVCGIFGLEKGESEV